MRIVAGRISAKYTGRGETELVPYDRIVIEKRDGNISIHGDKGFKPLNYMTGSCNKAESIINDEQVWVFSNKKESLTVTFHKVYDEINLELGDSDPGYSLKDKTEYQLQEWISKNINIIDPKAIFVEREHQTGDGPVDILARINPLSDIEHLQQNIVPELSEINNATWNSTDILIPIEVKRTAAMPTVGQLLRYMNAIKERDPHIQVQGVIAAVEIKKKTLTMAAKNNIKCVLVPNDWHDQYLAYNENQMNNLTMLDGVATYPEKDTFSHSLFEGLLK